MTLFEQRSLERYAKDYKISYSHLSRLGKTWDPITSPTQPTTDFYNHIKHVLANISVPLTNCKMPIISSPTIYDRLPAVHVFVYIRDLS